MEFPPEWFDDPLSEVWKAVDDLWRIELKGDADLTQRWRIARNKVAFLRERWSDLLRLEAYEKALHDHAQQAAPRSLRPHGPTKRPPAQIRHAGTKARRASFGQNSAAD